MLPISNCQRFSLCGRPRRSCDFVEGTIARRGYGCTTATPLGFRFDTRTTGGAALRPRTGIRCSRRVCQGCGAFQCSECPSFGAMENRWPGVRSGGPFRVREPHHRGIHSGILSRVGDFGMQTDRPVFLVGLPRSGTTLIEQILASHSQVFGAGELTLARDAFAATCDSGKNPGIQHSSLDREGIQRLAGRHLDELHGRNDGAARD